MLSDFGGYPPSAPRKLCRVQDLDGLRSAVIGCCELAMPMRVRCFAHSMNGMAVPSRNEMLLDMTGIRHVHGKERGVVTAGAGLSVWELDAYVRRFGWKLPVINDGGAEAPSVGGFIAAGGIGEATVYYGGFWESVRSVALVTGDGRCLQLGWEEPIFPWLFGGLGAFGVVYEATFELVPVSGAQSVPVADVSSLPKLSAAAWPDHLWLTLFVSEQRREEAIARLRWLMDRHPRAWQPRNTYEYYLLRRRFNPPLLFEEATDFIALGIWGDRLEGDADLSNYLSLEQDFQDLAERFGFRRYFQTELIRKHRPLESYVGKICAAQYRTFKKTFDPQNLLNEFHRGANPG